jgi:Tfp pilus assembly protein PilW
MKTPRMNSKQTGATLMEVLVAMSISLVVTAAMIAMMANSLGTTARIIQMTKLTDDMRVALQMMSRDVRRSNYNVDSMYCYSNPNCTSNAIKEIADVDIPSSECFWYLTDRNQDDYTDLDAIAAGGFRRMLVDQDDGSPDVGVIEMWTGGAAPDCSAAAGAAGWVQITNPESMDIFSFSVDDDLSYTQVIKVDDAGNTAVSQRVRKVRMEIQGRLVLDPTIVRQMGDVIAIRNDLLLIPTT